MDSYLNDQDERENNDDFEERDDDDQGGRDLDSDNEEEMDQREQSPMEYNDLFMQPIKMKAGDMFFKLPNKPSDSFSSQSLKASNNSDRYKQPEDTAESEEIEGRQKDQEDDEDYGDEIVDLGDDVQPFSMQFKLEKPKNQTIKEPDLKPFHPISIPKKRGGGFDLSEMILGRQARPMEVEDRIEDDEELELKDISVSMKVDEENNEETYDDPYYLMDRLKADSKKKNNSLFEMSISVTKKLKPEEVEQIYDDEDEEDRDEIVEREEEKESEPFNYDSAMYQKFSSSYKFNNNEIQDFRNMACNGNVNDEQYKNNWRRAAAYDDDIEDDSVFEPIQDDTFEEEEYIKAPKLDMSELSKTDQPKDQATSSKKQLGDNLSLLRSGLNDLDLRKPVSVEKKIQNGDTNQKQIDIIQHNKSKTDEEIPELIRDKNAKIIKHTKNEVLNKLTKKAYKNEDDSGSDGDFDRSSNDEFNADLLQKETKNNYEQIDKNGVKWTVLNDNHESSWNQLKKFERWMIIDAIRPQVEWCEKEEKVQPALIGGKVMMSQRLNTMMDKILANLSQRQFEKEVKKRVKGHKVKYNFKCLDFGDSFITSKQEQTSIIINPCANPSGHSSQELILPNQPAISRSHKTLSDKFIPKKSVIRIRETPLIRVFQTIEPPILTGVLESTFNGNIYDNNIENLQERLIENNPLMHEMQQCENFPQIQTRNKPVPGFLKERQIEDKNEEFQRQSVLSATPQPLLEEHLLTNAEWYRQVTDNTPQQLINFDQLLLQDQDPFYADKNDYQHNPYMHSDDNQMLRSCVKRASSLNSNPYQISNNSSNFEVASKKLRISRKSIQFVRGAAAQNQNRSNVIERVKASDVYSNSPVHNKSLAEIKPVIEQIKIDQPQKLESDLLPNISDDQVTLPSMSNQQPPRILKIKKAIIIPKPTEVNEMKLHPIINQLKLRTNLGLQDNSASKNLKIANKSSDVQKIKLVPKKIIPDQGLIQDQASSDDISPPVFKSLDAGNDIKVEDFDDYISEPALIETKPPAIGSSATLAQIRLKIQSQQKNQPSQFINNLPKQRSNNLIAASNSPQIGRKLHITPSAAVPTSQLLAALQAISPSNKKGKNGSSSNLFFKDSTK